MQCVASLIEVQNQRQPLYFVHKKFGKIIFISVKHPKMAILGGWIPIQKLFISKGGSCDSLLTFTRSLYPHCFGKKKFSIIIMSSICPGYPEMYKYWDLNVLLHCTLQWNNKKKNCLSYSKYVYALRKYGVWARYFPSCYLEKS